MLWLDITLYILGILLISLALFPFSPMTLKLYMPSRELMISVHRNGMWFWGIGLLLFAVLVGRVLTAAASPGWGWAVAGSLVFFALFYWGGYVPVIMHPPVVQVKVTSQEADTFLKPEEDVLGLVVDGEARAYSRKELTRPHVVFDEVADNPLAITYCILCNTAIAFRTELRGKRLNFRPVTAYNNNIIYCDAASGNYIQQLDGRVISGPDAGAELEALSLMITTWQAWKALHPDTKVVHVPATGFRDKMLGWMLDWMIPLPGLARRKGPWHPVQGQVDQRLPAMSMVVGVDLADQQCVYPMKSVREQKVINDTVGDTPLVILYDQERDAVSVYSRQLEDQVLTFKSNAEGTDREIVAIDEETGQRWDINGMERQQDDRAVGRRLEPIPHFGKLFWFSWSLFKSQTDVKGAV